MAHPKKDPKFQPLVLIGVFIGNEVLATAVPLYRGFYAVIRSVGIPAFAVFVIVSTIVFMLRTDRGGQSGARNVLLRVVSICVALAVWVFQWNGPVFLFGALEDYR